MICRLVQRQNIFVYALTCPMVLVEASASFEIITFRDVYRNIRHVSTRRP